MIQPLEGVRVIDLSRILAGPWATQTLADLGADVIKVERPGRGDDTRTWGPPYAGGDGEPGEATYFLGINRGKRSIEIDLKHPDGAGLVREMARSADVLVENFKFGDLERRGLGYAALKADNPGLVYCSITGFGQSGPRAKKAGYDLIVQGMAGLMSITGHADGEPGGGPLRVGVAIVDVLTGLYGAIGILAALRERAETGQGRHIDLALFDVSAACLANQATSYLVGGAVPGRMGNSHPSIVPYQTFEVEDGHLVIAVGNDRQFVRFCDAIGLAELAADGRFTTNALRVANRNALIALIAPVLAGRTRAQWIETLEPVEVPVGPINGLDEVFGDPQAVARELVRELPHTALGRVASVAGPIRLDGRSATADRGPPVLGEHTDAVLGDVLGLSAEQIGELRRAGIVGGE